MHQQINKNTALIYISEIDLTLGILDITIHNISGREGEEMAISPPRF